MNMFEKVVAWFKEYDDEITWFIIGSMFADGTTAIAKQETVFGSFMLFISAALWYFYMKDLKGRK